MKTVGTDGDAVVKVTTSLVVLKVTRSDWVSVRLLLRLTSTTSRVSSTPPASRASDLLPVATSGDGVTSGSRSPQSVDLFE